MTGSAEMIDSYSVARPAQEYFDGPRELTTQTALHIARRKPFRMLLFRASPKFAHTSPGGRHGSRKIDLQYCRNGGGAGLQTRFWWRRRPTFAVLAEAPL